MITASEMELTIDGTGKKVKAYVAATTGDPEKALTACMAGAVACQRGGKPLDKTEIPYSFKKKKE